MQVIGPTNPFRADLLLPASKTTVHQSNHFILTRQDKIWQTKTGNKCCKQETCLVFVAGVIHSGVAVVGGYHKSLLPGFVVVKILLTIIRITPCPHADVETRLSEQDCHVLFLKRHTADAQFQSLV